MAATGIYRHYLSLVGNGRVFVLSPCSKREVNCEEVCMTR
jgi:hypothetical protein